MIAGSDITVVVPSLPERSDWLGRAAASVERQSVLPADLVVHIDHDRAGAAAARNAALQKVTTDWVAFLDDDDRFYPNHLETLIDGANHTGADLVYNYPWPDDRRHGFALEACKRGIRCSALNIPWSPEARDHLDSRNGLCPHCRTKAGSFIMVTNLVRMELVDKIGGFPPSGSMGTDFDGWAGEDYLFLLALLDAGADFHHTVGRRTWTYHVK